ncbi:DUF2268 domain-containing putative Zn-dependent protease [Agaribacter marinus]|uniref:DUF2268 domain-containing protein n=1 Tax=Agaribacter marinus TaxID=1431249 RepID=A0AA37WIP9_9ALTE|nr:DUF2268 domain-containing putative Zn-dependent protease [Agaribacter marinus]GLR69634.1 hypothetical protein GCM10007852_05420 [Agaribacter marinus]
MNRITLISVLIAFAAFSTFTAIASQGSNSTANDPLFTFVPSETADFTAEQENRIKKITVKVIAKVQKSFPSLSNKINFNFLMEDRDLTIVNGVAGRADRANSIEINISSIYAGGVDKAIDDSLKRTLFHELHHIARGWLVLETKFGYGIDIAAINEGLAEVYSELEAGHSNANYTGNPDFDAWTKEILALPVQAHSEYAQWMFQHSDGRQAIGYRTGAWIVKKAMAASGKDIEELTQMSVKDIYAAAGYKFRNND